MCGGGHGVCCCCRCCCLCSRRIPRWPLRNQRKHPLLSRKSPLNNWNEFLTKKTLWQFTGVSVFVKYFIVVCIRTYITCMYVWCNCMVQLWWIIWLRQVFEWERSACQARAPLVYFQNRYMYCCFSKWLSWMVGWMDGWYPGCSTVVKFGSYSQRSRFYVHN